MPGNVISYELLNRINEESGFLWQGDYGQKMKLTGIDLPVAYTVHFANSSKGSSVPSIGDATGVAIPDQVLTSGRTVYFWLFLHPDANSGQTVYANMIKIHPRTALPTIDPPTPAEQSILDQLMAALEAGIAQVNSTVEAIPGMVDDEIELKKDEFRGDPGAVFTPAVVDGVMIWTNNGGLPNPEPTDFNTELGLDNFATKQELNGKIDSGVIGSANGVAGLDASGRVPSEQLPSYVDDVLEFPSVSQFPNPGESGKIYISTSNNHQYRWTGTQYIDITSGDMETRKADKRDTVLETTLSRGRRAGTNVGTGSIAFGNYTEAPGEYATALGKSTMAVGEGSTAFGESTEATAADSHAEGYSTHATGQHSHTEGRYTTASGTDSHAEGYWSEASGFVSHAEGNNTKATGSYSHAEGSNTKATRSHTHAEGSFSEANSDSAHAEGESTRANGVASHAEGVGGTFSVAQTEYISGSNGAASHSEGYTTYANGYGAHSEGHNTVSSNDGAHAEGNGTIASGTAAHTEGSGTHATASNAHAEGDNAKAIGISSHAEGGGTQAIGASSHAEGGGSRATGNGSHAEGGGTTASGDNSHSEGSGTTASGGNSHAEGGGSQAAGNYSHAEGSGTRATGDYSHAEGGGSQATADCAHAEGGGTQATARSSHAEGQATAANGVCSHVGGYATIASGAYSYVSGKFNVADSYANWPEWTQGEHCVPGDKRKRTRIVDEETVIEGFICKTENSDADWDDTHWINQYGRMNYAEVIGNGAGSNDRSNAYCLDWDGNGHFAGDVYVGCNADGTGGTKLELVPFATDAETMSIFESA